MVRNNFYYFEDREGRAKFIHRFFESYINKSKSILDVGCSNNDLKKIIGEKVYGIDKSGNPDKKMDLEKDKLSIFEKNSFDMVVCTEVLEHIDNLYEILDDINRVASKYILISLPNSPDIWKVLRIILFASSGKYYGLPSEKPEDRHKWFFSWKELDKFFSNYCRKFNLKILESFMHFNYSNSGKEFVLKALLKIFPIRLFAQNYWILIEK
ncbi:MAG: methyltransferase domain-containing protein [Patescibacteria group bacterium]